MLTPYLAPPSSVAPAPAIVASVFAAPAETSGVALPSFAVASAAAEARVQNQRQGGGAAVMATASAPDLLEELASAPSASDALASFRSAGAPPVIRFSSQFLAQMFAQLPVQDNAVLMAELADNTPTSVLDARVMELFGQVKYKPSNAFKPADPARGVVALMAAAEAASRVPAMPARAPANAYVAANGNWRLPSAGNDNRPAPTMRPEPSLVRTSGAQAYTASMTRNEVNLRAPAVVATAAAPEMEDGVAVETKAS
jgi:hypothetical protein